MDDQMEEGFKGKKKGKKDERMKRCDEGCK